MPWIITFGIAFLLVVSPGTYASLSDMTLTPHAHAPNPLGVNGLVRQDQHVLRTGEAQLRSGPRPVEQVWRTLNQRRPRHIRS
jgi:hypothetical protein